MRKRDFRVRFSDASVQDLRIIARHLERTTGNIRSAVVKTKDIRKTALMLPERPYQGTKRDDLLTGLRIVPKGKAVIAFIICEKEKTIDVLGFFYGGQDYESILQEREPQKPS